ncbi:MAG: long-chain fatty acid--CoA ligase [Calditrichaceae bacterium]|nr:long-chain fatty acid--CoA ligase [Calditrichaceae bacterium]MBN2708808.1 long-chain fatty acid--CoA ligase [Calditrichaceae bacterium]RQV97663.1 MAG: long-chain fatty acid--CoA ligase [Calditrichota bacterium]
MKYKNLADMFFQKRMQMPELTGYMFKKGNQWIKVNYKDAVDRAERIAAGLIQLGLKKGDKVSIISANRIEWALTDYAVQSLGAILVPIYPSLLANQVSYILNDSESVVVIVSDLIQYQKVESVRTSLTFTKHFFYMDSEGIGSSDLWTGLDKLEQKGQELLDQNPQIVSSGIDKVGLEDWATIIYTSGTTGEPKGAILTNNNFLSNIEAALEVFDISSDDNFLSFLPLSHIFERMAGHYLSCYTGCCVAYAESVDTVAENLKEISPTLMISVPRLYEKIYGKITETVESGSPVKRKIFYWAVNTGKKYINKIMNKQPVPALLKKKYALAHKLVFHKLHQALGGRNRFMISGGAPLSPDIAEFFGAIGVKIMEGYGLTETSPVITANVLDNFRFGTVGQPIPGVEVKIADDGEILTRGPHVMVGYYKKEAETGEVIDSEGWFYTGDIGVFEDGMLKITDRKKNLIVTSGGKNIAPQPIENMLVTSHYIEQAVMIGDKRKYCTAIIVAAADALKRWAKENSLETDDYNRLITLPQVKELMMSEIRRLTVNLASYETIKDFVISPTAFSIETGELTPSLKVKRRVVEEKFSAQIAAMYER